MAQHNQENIKACIPVSTKLRMEMSPPYPTIHKTPQNMKYDNALTQIQSQIKVFVKEMKMKGYNLTRKEN